MRRNLWRRWLRPAAILIGGILVLLSFGGGLTGDPHPPQCYHHTCPALDDPPPPGN